MATQSVKGNLPDRIARDNEAASDNSESIGAMVVPLLARVEAARVMCTASFTRSLAPFGTLLMKGRGVARLT